MPSDLRDAAARAALPVAVFFAVTVEMAPVGAVSTIARDLGAGVERVALGSTAYAAATAVVAVPGALLLRAAPLRRAVVVAGAVFAAAAALSVAAADLPAFLVTRALTGVAHGCFFPLALALAARSSVRPERAVAHVLLGNAGALALGVPVVEALSTWSWRVPLLVAAVAVALAAAGAPPERVRAAAADGRAGGAPPGAVLALAAAFALALAGHFTFYTFLTPLAESASSSATAVLGAYGVAVVVAALVAGPLSGRSRLPRACAVAAVEGVLLAALAATGAPVAVVAAGVVAGLCFGLLPALVQSEMLAIAGDRATLASAVAVVAFNVGIAAGAALGGAASSRGPGAPPLLGGALLVAAAVAIAACAVVQRPARRSPGHGSPGHAGGGAPAAPGRWGAPARDGDGARRLVRRGG